MAATAIRFVANLSDTCTLCQRQVVPRDIMRLDTLGNCRCPHCGGVYNCTPPNPVTSMSSPPIRDTSVNDKPTCRVYMRFELCLGVWRVTLKGPGNLREFTFADNSKVEEMAERGGALRTLADRQGFEAGLRQGRGGVEMRLTKSQLSAVRR